MKLDTACSEGMQGRSAEQAPPLQAGARPQAFKKIKQKAKQLAKQQELSRAAASGVQHSQGGGGGGPHKGGKGDQESNRAVKSRSFWDGAQARKSARQEGRKGKGGKAEQYCRQWTNGGKANTGTMGARKSAASTTLACPCTTPRPSSQTP